MGQWNRTKASLAIALSTLLVVAAAAAAPPLSGALRVKPLGDLAATLPSLDQIDLSKLTPAQINQADLLRQQYAQSCMADVGFIPQIDCTTGV